MSSQASSASRDEAKVRQKLVETGDVDVTVAIRSDFYRKVTCKIDNFSPEQEQNLLGIVWLYRGETGRYLDLVAG